jgi:anti-sigma B factor antagonist
VNATLRIASNGDVCIAVLEGEVDLASARHLCAEILRQLSTESLGVVLDLSAVRYLDSTGVSLLFDVHRALGERRQRLAIVVPETSNLRRLFKITSLGAVIPIRDTVEEASRTASGE